MNIHPAFQLRRYAWSAKLPLGILTDFEEFAVYDCRVKPDKRDKASVGRVMLISYKDYIEKWDELASIFSREAVFKGSFDSYAEGMKTRKGTTEVDDAFLAEIERWRDLLAKNIALRAVDFDGVFIADHIPTMGSHPQVGTAYTIGYMKALLARVNDEAKE